MRLRCLALPFLVLLAGCSTAASGGVAASPSPSGAMSLPTSASPANPSTAVSGTAATPSPSAGTVVNVYGRFSTAAQINAATWLPSDARTFLVGQLEHAEQGFRVDGSNAGNCAVLEVSGYRVPDLIDGSEFSADDPSCAGPGGRVLWGKVAGQWKLIVAAQGEPACSDIRDAGWTSTIPEEWLGGQCMEKDRSVIYAP